MEFTLFTIILLRDIQGLNTANCYSAKRQYYNMRDIVVGVPIVPLH